MVFNWHLWAPVATAIGGAIAADRYPKHRLAILGATALGTLGAYAVTAPPTTSNIDARRPVGVAGSLALVGAGAAAPFLYRPPPHVVPRDTSRPSGFPPAIVRALQARFVDAVHRQQWGEVVRLGALFEQAGIPRPVV